MADACGCTACTRLQQARQGSAHSGKMILNFTPYDYRTIAFKRTPSLCLVNSGATRVTIMFLSRVACSWVKRRKQGQDLYSERQLNQSLPQGSRRRATIWYITLPNTIRARWIRSLAWKAEEGVESRATSKPGCRVPPRRPYLPKLVSAVIRC